MHLMIEENAVKVPFFCASSQGLVSIETSDERCAKSLTVLHEKELKIRLASKNGTYSPVGDSWRI